MNNTLLKAITLSGISLITINSAFAGDVSVGLMAGKTNFDSISDVCDDIRNQGSAPFFPVGCSAPDDSDTAAGLNISYHINNTWAIEAGYVDLGEYTTTISVSRISTDIVLEAESIYLSVVSSLPISNRFSFSARAGAYEARGNIGSEINSIDSEVDSDIEFYAGASLDFRATDKVTIQARYDSFDDIDTLTAGVQFRF